MKKLFFLLFFGFFVSLMAQKESLETKMFFSSREEAEEAFTSGNFRYYQPNPDNLKAKPPRLAKGLPSPYVVLESVRENSGKSPAWVLLNSGTPAEFNSSGVPIVDGRCWNKIHQAFPLEKYVLLSQIGKLYGPAGKNGKDGHDGKDGIDGINGRDTNLEELKRLLEELEEKDRSSFWTDWGIPLLAGTITGIAAGYAFPEKNEIINQEIIPGAKQETGDSGTFIFGPQKIKETKSVERKFSWENASYGFGIGFISVKIAL